MGFWNRSVRQGVVWSAAVVCLLVWIGWTNTPTQSAQGLTAEFIDVGQGDSILLRDGAGFDVLIDGGPADAGAAVLAALRTQGVAEIDVLVATHPDSDHIGGLIAVLNAVDIPVRKVLASGYPGTTATWANFVTAVANEGVSLETVQFPAVLTWGQMTAYILNPPAGLVSPATNDASVVIRLDYGQVRLLLPGDIPSSVESAVAARQTPVAAQVLKVAHHGSKYSSSAGFLAAVQPEEAVISVGVNSYGHPAAETITRLEAAGARVWRTDLDGDVWVTSDGNLYGIWNLAAIHPRVYLPLALR